MNRGYSTRGRFRGGPGRRLPEGGGRIVVLDDVDLFRRPHQQRHRGALISARSSPPSVDFHTSVFHTRLLLKYWRKPPAQSTQRHRAVCAYKPLRGNFPRTISIGRARYSAFEGCGIVVLGLMGEVPV